MKKLIIAILVMASFGVQADNYTDTFFEIRDLYTDFGSEGTALWNSSGVQADSHAVSRNSNLFVEAFRETSTKVDFDPETWTVTTTDISTADLETARTNLRTAETNLINRVTSDLVGDGTVANTWGSAELAQARLNGGLVGGLTANYQEDARDITDTVATADLQTIYEDDGALDSYFDSVTTEVAALQTEVNSTRVAVANARDGFALTGTAIDNNTDSIGVDVNNTSLTGTVLTADSGTRVQVSDYFTTAIAVVVGADTILEAIARNTYTGDRGAYVSGFFEYTSFTNFVINHNGVRTRTDATVLGYDITIPDGLSMTVAANGTDSVDIGLTSVGGIVYGGNFGVNGDGNVTLPDTSVVSLQEAIDWFVNEYSGD